MKVKVTERGLFIPKKLLDNAEEVEIRKGQDVILVAPVTATDPILELGAQPIVCREDDASDSHDRRILLEAAATEE